LLLVHFPTEKGSHAYAQLSWAGFVGALTGVSSAPLGINEKVWLGYEGEYARMGQPFTFVLRDILQFDSTNEDAVTRMRDAPRTCAIYAGVGNAAENKFEAAEYSYTKVVVWNETSQPNYAQHPRIKNIVYIDKHVQPSSDPCLPDLLKENYGHITAENYAQNITALHQTGDNHWAVYDYANSRLLVAVAGPSNGELCMCVYAAVRLCVARNRNDGWHTGLQSTLSRVSVCIVVLEMKSACRGGCEASTRYRRRSSSFIFLSSCASCVCAA